MSKKDKNNISDSIEEELEENKELNEDSSVNINDTPSQEKVKKIKYIATKTKKVYCNKYFDLVEGQEISKELPESFYKSLININLIKKIEE